jgi:hypothetical protein
MTRNTARKLAGRSRLLLGVNSDDDMAKLKEQMNAERITARSCRDGGGSANAPGPIARQFNIDRWPSFYLLDAHGVIRHKFFGTPGNQMLNSAIAALLQVAEAEGGARK